MQASTSFQKTSVWLRGYKFALVLVRLEGNCFARSLQVGVYFLIGNDDGGEPSVYIGQTGELRKRLNQHHKDSKKDFWERALVLISRTHSLTQTHTLFLEWLSLQEAKNAGRYADQNGNSGSKPHTPAPLEAGYYLEAVTLQNLQCFISKILPKRWQLLFNIPFIMPLVNRNDPLETLG